MRIIINKINYQSQIKEIRESKNLTQEKLAEELNINISTLRN